MPRSAHQGSGANLIAREVGTARYRPDSPDLGVGSEFLSGPPGGGPEQAVPRADGMPDGSDPAGIRWSGLLEVVLEDGQGRVVPTVTYRPPSVRSLVVGRDATDAARTVRRLHSLCGQAHEIAFRRAIESLGAGPGVTIGREVARGVLLDVEAHVAHARRVALELEPGLGRAVPAVALKAVQDAAEGVGLALGLADAASAFDPRPVVVCDTMAQLHRAYECLLAGAREAPSSRRLHALPASLRGLVVDGWQRPWRFAAEVQLSGRGRLDPFMAEPALDDERLWYGRGEGRAMTSRGVLIYEVELRHGFVGDCIVDTPTARLATPGGELASALARLRWSPGVKLAADLVIRALDPCVPWTIQVGGARDA